MYRLDVLRLFLPPLRQREKDVEFLFCHLLKNLCQDMGVKLSLIHISLGADIRAKEFQHQLRMVSGKSRFGNACFSVSIQSGKQDTRFDLCGCDRRKIGDCLLYTSRCV